MNAKSCTDEPSDSGPYAHGVEATNAAGASEHVTVSEEGCLYWSSVGNSPPARRETTYLVVSPSLVPAKTHMPRINPPGWHVRQKLVMRWLALTEETGVPQRGQG